MDEFEQENQKVNDPYPAPESSREEPPRPEPSGYGQYEQSPYSQTERPGGAPPYQEQRPNGPYGDPSASQSPYGDSYGGAYGQQPYSSPGGAGYSGGAGGAYTQQPYTGYYAESQIPPEVRKWNWGAFMFNWIWGCGNGAYLALLYFIPVFGWFVWPFVCGARGNIWAWKSGKFKDLDTFLTTQRTWNIAGIIMFCLWVASIVISVMMMVWSVALLLPWNSFLENTGFSEYQYNVWD
jgi:hypothetical protein